MLTIQEMADIATRYATAASDALIIACVQRHYRTGEPLTLVARAVPVPERGERPVEDVRWAELVERNGSTRHNHC